MHLPINISDLLHSNVVESDRIEFKADWNPEAVLRTICAFANDFNNFGGGYIIIGIGEQHGKPILPPEGISTAKADKVQKDLVRLFLFEAGIYANHFLGKLSGKTGFSYLGSGWSDTALCCSSNFGKR